MPDMRPRCGGSRAGAGCGQAIRWVTTPTGKYLPLDPEPARDGTVVIGDDSQRGRVLTRAELAAYAGPRYTVHWSTCPNADTFRRGRQQRGRG